MNQTNHQVTSSKIITVTLNSAIDFFIEVDNFSAGDNVVAANCVEFASGKGVNAAKATELLGCPVKTLGFVGLQSQALFDALESTLLLPDFCLVKGKTRTNITLFDGQNNTETHIRTSGYSVTAADCGKLLEKLNSELVAGDIMILSGSLPTNTPPDLYRTIIKLCHSRSAIPFLDTQGNSLSEGLKAGPYMIKPNQQEFEKLVGRKLNDAQEIVAAARNIINGGPLLIIVSRGKQGAVYIDAKIAKSAVVDVKAYGNPLSTIGCGDALVAGFAVAKLHGYDLSDAIKISVACGAANLFSVEPGRFDIRQFAQLKKRVIIRNL